MDHETIKKHLKKETDRVFWIGVVLGLVAGLILGGLIGYDMGSDHVVVIPLEQGVET